MYGCLLPGVQSFRCSSLSPSVGYIQGRWGSWGTFLLQFWLVDLIYIWIQYIISTPYIITKSLRCLLVKTEDIILDIGLKRNMALILTFPFVDLVMWEMYRKQPYICQNCYTFYFYEVYTFSVFVEIVKKLIILLYVYYWGHSGWWWCTRLYCRLLSGVLNILSIPLT